MTVAAQISMAEYLDTDYSPDREYVDGVVVERNVGKRPHSLVQRQLVIAFHTRYPSLFIWPEQRVLTVPDRRSRVPDVCVTLVDPCLDIFETPPFICIEVLSQGDALTDLLEKLEEYAGFGVPHIWVIDPRRQKAYTFLGSKLEEFQGDALVTTGPEIRLPLEEVFRGL